MVRATQLTTEMKRRLGQDAESRRLHQSQENRIKTNREDKPRDKNRHRVERFFVRIKPFRRVAIRHEKTAEILTGFVGLAALALNLR